MQTNRQTRSAYLSQTTSLSSMQSQAYAHFLAAHVAIQNILIAELGDGHDMIESNMIVRLLADSQRDLSRMKIAIADLRMQMQTDGYNDPALRDGIDLVKIVTQIGSFIVAKDDDSWSVVTTTMQRSGVVGMFDIFDDCIDAINEQTGALSDKVTTWLDQQPVGERYIAFDENTPANFTVELVQIVTAWATFQQFFHVTNLIMAALSYQDQDSVGTAASEPALAAAA